MTISYLYVGVLDKVMCKKVVSKGWCKESSFYIQNFNAVTIPSILKLIRLTLTFRGQLFKVSLA